jgi:hypothetical protein
MTELTPEEREHRIRETMEATGVTLAEAEFIYAQETGEIEGDVIVVLTEDKPFEK